MTLRHMRHILISLVVVGLFGFGLQAATLKSNQLTNPPSSPETATSLYNKYAQKNPAKGMTEQEFEAYLVDHLSPDPETAEALAALYGEHSRYYEIMKPRIQDAWTRVLYGTGNPDSNMLQRVAFGEFLKKYPPGSGLPTLTVAAPTSPKSDILAKISGNKLKVSNLHVTKSASQPGTSGLPGGIDPGPAQFNWTKASGSSSVFTIDGALSYDYQASDWLFLVPSVEAHTSTDSSAQQNSIKTAISLKAWLTNDDSNGSRLLAGQVLSFAPAYETDNKKQTETYGGEFFYTPILNLWGMEGYQRLDFWRDCNVPTDAQTPAGVQNQVYPGFSWTLAVGSEAGHARSPTIEEDYARFVVKLHADLYLTPRFDIATDYAHRTFFTGDKKSFDYAEVSAIWYLDSTQEDPKKQNAAIGMTFKNGETTPQFQKIDSVSAWLGVKF